MTIFDNETIDVLVLVSIAVCLVLIIGLCCIVCYLYKRQISKQRYDLLEERVAFIVHEKDKTSLKFDSSKVWKDILPRNWDELENKFCTISFRNSHQHTIDKLLDDCFIGRHRERNFGKETFTVKEYRDVLSIPPCKIMLIFIEKSEDKMILEISGKHENDLKLLTVKSCRKMNDEDSENIIPGLLYNPQISAVTEHPELKELEQMDRVLTCNKKFTISQRDKIADLIV